MLAKLIKHELRMTSRTFIPVYLLALFMSVMQRISVSLLNARELGQFDAAFADSMFSISMLITFAYTISLAAVGFASAFFIISRFYKSMTTNEGYLTHTLPVKTSTLIWSKAITALIWTISSILIIGITVLILTAGTEAFRESIPSIVNGFKNFIRSYNGEGNPFILGIEWVLSVLSNWLFFIFSVYASIAIGQLCSKYRIAASLGAYFLIDMAVRFVKTFISIPIAENAIAFDVMDIISLLSNRYLPLSIAFTGILAMFLYFVTWYIFTHKLNLE